MLLALDIGNSTIHAGIFDGDSLIQQNRIATHKNSGKEYYVAFFETFNAFHLKAISISSVVPEINELITSLCIKSLSITPFYISAQNSAGITVTCDDLGSDRFANCVAAYKRARRSCIIVDFGTAITFDAVSKEGKFLGGAIAPGLQLSFNALTEKASQLRTVPLVIPDHVVANGTTENVQSGLIFGFASLADGMISRMNNELHDTPALFLTGGQGSLIASAMQSNISVVPELTLEGIRIIWEEKDNATSQ